MNSLNEEFTFICNTLNVSEDDLVGGIINVNITYDMIKKIMENTENYIDLSRTQNDSPTMETFINFCKEHPQFAMIGYVVSPKRDDYRISVDGIKGPNTEENIKLLDGFIRNAETMPDEYGLCTDDFFSGVVIRAWWD